ncbi:uncharacterized protein [Palaemon carinicauda]|uniref:uncharacterized protein isoform X2 n=1 Tax=Palaemon carinicauda TaxID=392227 RepID=UPI0035B58946
MPEGPAPELPPGARIRRSSSARATPRASPRASPRSSPHSSRHGSLRREGEDHPHALLISTCSRHGSLRRESDDAALLISSCSRHGSLRRASDDTLLITTPIHLEPRVVIAGPKMHTLPLPLGDGEYLALSPLGTPLLATPVSPTTPTPATPVSPIIPRIISTNWESLGAYDPYR